MKQDIIDLSKKAKDAPDANTALKFSQAAYNLAMALKEMENTNDTKIKED